MNHCTEKDLLEFQEKVRCKGGNESELCSIFENVRKDDWVVCPYPSHYHYLLKGGNREELEDKFMAKNTASRTKRSHTLPNLRIIRGSSAPSLCSVSCGLALGIKKSHGSKKSRPHVWCFLSDVDEDRGEFVESARFGIARALPLTFIIEDSDTSRESNRKARWHNFTPIVGRNIIRYVYKETS